MVFVSLLLVFYYCVLVALFFVICSGVTRRGDPRLGPLEDPSMGPLHFGGARDWYKFAVPGSLHGDAVPCLSIGKAGTRIDLF